MDKIAKNGRVTTTLLQDALMSSVDPMKLQMNIHNNFGVYFSVEQLKQMPVFYQLLQRIREEATKQK